MDLTQLGKLPAEKKEDPRIAGGSMVAPGEHGFDPNLAAEEERLNRHMQKKQKEYDTWKTSEPVVVHQQKESRDKSVFDSTGTRRENH